MAAEYEKIDLGNSLDRSETEEQIARILAEEISGYERKSVFRRAVDYLTLPYHKSDTALAYLIAAKQETAVLNKAALSADKKDDGVGAAKAIIDYNQAKQKEEDSFSILGSALKSMGFFIPNKLGYALAASTHALDEYKIGDNKLDILQGAAKGMASKHAMTLMVRAQWSAPAQALGLGLSTRFAELGLSRQNYLDDNGKYNLESFKNGTSTVLAGTFNPMSLTADIAGFGLARTFMKPFSNIVKNNAGIAALATGSIFGFSSGIQEEGARQWQKQEIDLTRLAAFPLAKGVISGLFAYPGGAMQVSRDRLDANRSRALDMEYRLVAVPKAEVNALSQAAGTLRRVKLNPIDEKGALLPAQDYDVVGIRNKERTRLSSLFFGNYKELAPRWQATDRNKETATTMSLSGTEAAELRFVGRKTTGDDNSVWSMQLAAPGEHTVQGLLSKTSTKLRTAFLFGGKSPGESIATLNEPALKVLGSGMQSVAVELANGGVLKLSKTAWDKEWGNRPFDARLLSQVTQFKDGAANQEKLSLYVQEPVVPASFLQYVKTSDRIEKGRNYQFVDAKPAQVGRALRAHGETTVLIDYASVERR